MVCGTQVPPLVNLDSDGIITRNKSQSGKEQTQVCYSLWVEHDKLFIIIIIIIVVIYIIIIIIIIIILSLLLLLCYSNHFYCYCYGLGYHCSSLFQQPFLSQKLYSGVTLATCALVYVMLYFCLLAYRDSTCYVTVLLFIFNYSLHPLCLCDCYITRILK